MSDDNLTSSIIRGKRLKKFLDKKYPKTSERAKSNMLNIPDSTLRGWIEGREIPADGLITIYNAGCDLHWLLTGAQPKNYQGALSCRDREFIDLCLDLQQTLGETVKLYLEDDPEGREELIRRLPQAMQALLQSSAGA